MVASNREEFLLWAAMKISRLSNSTHEDWYSRQLDMTTFLFSEDGRNHHKVLGTNGSLSFVVEP